jgi:hypothetical protein
MGQGAALLLRRETILRIGTQLKWCFQIRRRITNGRQDKWENLPQADT